jgi:hypothetical protein
MLKSSFTDSPEYRTWRMLPARQTASGRQHRSAPQGRVSWNVADAGYGTEWFPALSLK